MKVEDYSFGKINVEGKTYTSDVIIYPDRVAPSWRRKEGHYLHMEDLLDVLNERPEAVIVGTGYYGVMKVSADVVQQLALQGIEVHVERTGQAGALFNNLSLRKKTIACLHLTC